MFTGITLVLAMRIRSVLLILQIWKLRSRILTYFVQSYKGSLASKPGLSTVDHMQQVPKQLLGVVGKESTIIGHNRIFLKKQNFCHSRIGSVVRALA